eukprot:scaffold105099_cov26-Attheya_sp.AAC.1
MPLSSPSHDGDPSGKPDHPSRNSTMSGTGRPPDGTIDGWLARPGQGGGRGGSGRSNGRRTELTTPRPPATRSQTDSDSHARDSRSRSRESSTASRKPKIRNSFSALLDKEVDDDNDDEAEPEELDSLLQDFEGLSDSEGSMPKKSPFAKSDPRDPIPTAKLTMREQMKGLQKLMEQVQHVVATQKDLADQKKASKDSNSADVSQPSGELSGSSSQTDPIGTHSLPAPVQGPTQKEPW